MLSIAAMAGSGQGEYYLALAAEDYYQSGKEPPGLWWGDGAKALGLEGKVAADPFRNVLLGFSPDGREPLVQNAGCENRRSGWDLAFSVTKSVSTYYSQADRERRLVVEECHRKAVECALRYLEDRAAVTRLGKGGEETRSCGLVVARFDHSTSRAQDPQLHTHCLVLNVGTTEENGRLKTTALESHPFFEHKMAAGALYRAELASLLEQRLGVVCEREKSWFEIQGVPRALMTEFAKRREAIEAELKERGLSGARASAVAALATREKKETTLSWEERFEAWRNVGQEFGFTATEVRALSATYRDSRSLQVEKREALKEGLDKLTSEKSHFAERDLIQAVAEAAQARAIGGLATRSVVSEYLARDEAAHFPRELGRDVVYLGRDARGERRYTTRELRELELRMLDSTRALRASDTHALSLLRARELLQTSEARGRRPLSDEQRAAFTHITTDSGGIAVVSGMAGTGKTTLLCAVREAYEEAGYEVRGCALSGKAARGLEQGSGIKSSTIHSFIHSREDKKHEPSTADKRREGKETKRDGEEELSPHERKRVTSAWERWEEAKHKVLASWKYATWQVDRRTAQKLSGDYYRPKSEWRHEWWYATYQISKAYRSYLNAKLTEQRREERRAKERQGHEARGEAVPNGASPGLTPKTVLLVDEAGMVGTRHMAWLVSECRRSGAKLVLVGDPRQLQPVDMGGPFQHIAKTIGTAELRDIRRQDGEHASWQVGAIHHFASGNASEALKAYADRGFVSISETRPDASRALIDGWVSRGGAIKPEEHLIFAGTRAEVRELNRAAQKARHDTPLAPALAEGVTVGGERLLPGDRVLFTRNSKRYGVSNGDFGTVEAVHKAHSLHPLLVIRLDPDQKGEERRVTIPVESYQHLTLGYACTTHKSQGMTVENAYVLSGGPMQSREVTYVQASRARKETHFFTDRGEAPDDLEARVSLAREMSRGRQKDLSLDILPAEVSPVRETIRKAVQDELPLPRALEGGVTQGERQVHTQGF